MRWIAPFVLLVAAGCGPGQRPLMPLEVGHTWTYHTTSGMDARVETIKVVRPVSVLDVEGFELDSPLGESRMAWKNDELLADSSAGLRFSPPIPLIAENGRSARWVGAVTWLGRAVNATAELTQAQKSLTLGARTIEATQTDLVLHFPTQVFTLTTWFEPGVGIVKQEQRSGGKLDIGIEMVAGP